MVFPVLTTKRLVLRQLNDDDYPEIFALRSDDEVNKYIYRTKATHADQAKEFIKKINAGIGEGNSFYWAICFAEQTGLTGTICLWNLSEDKTTAEIGFELIPLHQRNGIMNEALEAVIRYAFDEIGLKTILGSVHHDNANSIRLLEKNNFKKDEFRKDPDDPDNVIYYLARP
jgi:ribosomal-protein-alanine N-acetyltransferase